MGAVVHVGFTGTQRGMTPVQLSVVRFYLGGFQWLHHGDCIGADHQAHMTARRKGISIWLHPPDNLSKRAFCDYTMIEAVKPYLDRNHDIVDVTPWLIAAPGENEEQLRSGTWAPIRYARKHDKNIIIVYPDGSYDCESP